MRANHLRRKRENEIIKVYDSSAQPVTVFPTNLYIYRHALRPCSLARSARCGAQKIAFPVSHYRCARARKGLRCSSSLVLFRRLPYREGRNLNGFSLRIRIQTQRCMYIYTHVPRAYLPSYFVVMNQRYIRRARREKKFNYPRYCLRGEDVSAARGSR